MMNKALISILAVIVLSTSACNFPFDIGLEKSITDAPASTPTSTRTSYPTLTPLPTLTSTATIIPTATMTPFVPKAYIKIFIQGPLTGDYASGGYDNLHAVELAIEQLAGPLASMGYKVELASYDDENNVERAVENAKEIEADPEVLCGVGHYSGPITNSALEIYHRAGLAILTANGEPEITNHGYIEVNRLNGLNLTQGAAAAQFAYDQGFGTAVTLNNPWGDYGLRNTYNFNAQSWILGSPLVVYSVTTDLVKGFDKIIARVIASKADVVYFAANGDQVGNFIREARAAGYMGTFMGPNSLSSTWILDFAGPLMLEGGGIYYTRLAAPASFYPKAAAFVADYTNKYGTSPVEGIANIYDGVGICLKAIEEASLAKDGELPTRGEVAKAIRAITDYQGIAGTYNFNSSGDLTMAEYYIVKAVSLDPEKWRQNPIVASYKMPPMK